MSNIYQPSNSINCADLNKLVTKQPQYASFFSGIAQIDTSIKAFVKEILNDTNVDTEDIYIKTELQNQCYNILLFSAEKNVTVGVSWPLVDFLQYCENKRVEYEVNVKVRKMIVKLNSNSVSPTIINWVD